MHENNWWFHYAVVKACKLRYMLAFGDMGARTLAFDSLKYGISGYLFQNALEFAPEVHDELEMLCFGFLGSLSLNLTSKFADFDAGADLGMIMLVHWGVPYDDLARICKTWKFVIIVSLNTRRNNLEMMDTSYSMQYEIIGVFKRLIYGKQGSEFCNSKGGR